MNNYPVWQRLVSVFFTKDFTILTLMPLLGRHKLNTTMTMLSVVPGYKPMHPSFGLRHILKFCNVTSKVRPAVAISTDTLRQRNGKYIVAMITSAMNAAQYGDVSISELNTAGLPAASVVS